MRYLLKIFSGPHVGAEVELQSGETTIGRSEECDLVLSDRLIAERHVVIDISGQSITCRTLGTETFLLDGKSVESAELRPFQYFTIGTTHLAIGPADKPWPHFDLSDFQLRPPVESAPVEAAEEGQSKTSSLRSGEQEEESLPTVRRRVFSKPVIAISIALFLLANAAFVFGGFSNGWLDAKPTVKLSRSENLPLPPDTFDTVSREFLPGITIEHSNQRLQVNGYVIKESDRVKLLDAAKISDPHVLFKVRSTESLLATVEEMLAQNGFSEDWSATIAEPGVIKITGSLHDDAHIAQWQATLERIEDDVPVKELIVDVERPEATVNIADNTAPVTTSVPDPPAPQPERILRSNPIPIVDVRIANDRVFTLPNGIQISVGGRLTDGSKVEEIHLEHAIVRTQSGQKMIVPFGL